MMVKVKSYSAVDVSLRDVFHFLRIGDASAREDLTGDVISVIEELKDIARPRVCSSTYDVSTDGEVLDLGFTKVKSRDLQKNLSGCREIILVAATVGLETDRAIAKYSRLSPARALILQAAGAAAVEATLDKLSEELKADGLTLRPRFSCGYGDLPLELQKDIFASLDCPKNIGVSLTDTFLMTPTKSVSAIIGIE